MRPRLELVHVIISHSCTKAMTTRQTFASGYFARCVPADFLLSASVLVCNNTPIIAMFRTYQMPGFLLVSIISHIASGIPGMQTDTMYRSHDVKRLMTFSCNHVITCCERCDSCWECDVKRQRKVLFSGWQLSL